VDIIETIDGSVIHHGRHNDRIYLMHLYEAAETRLIAKLDAMAMANGYGKIFAKIPVTRWKAFKSAGYVREAVIPGFFKGMTDGLFIAKFFSAERQKATGIENLLTVQKVLHPRTIAPTAAHRRSTHARHRIPRR
jgi:hypothetical protein